MSARKRSALILLVVAATIVAFLLGTISAAGSVPTALQALTPARWAAVDAGNSLLLNQGPVGLYLPIVARR